MALATVRSKGVVLLLLIRCLLILLFCDSVIVLCGSVVVTPIVRDCNCFMFCCALLYVHSSFALILMRKRELVAILCLSSWCLVIVVWLFLTMP